MSVKVGITSKPGRISSTKVIKPPIFPSVPLYILYTRKEAKGAQIISVNSPTPGIAKESIPIASKITPKMSNVYLLFVFINS